MGPHTHLSSLVRRQSVAVPAVLSVALLVVQLGVMGWGGSFPTQDGPAHLHTAMIWRSLLLEENTLFHRFCELAGYLPPNLLALVVLELLATLLNPAWAVSVLAVLSVLLLYGAVAYARCAVFPTCNSLDPSLNGLLPVLFLVLGLFNFYWYSPRSVRNGLSAAARAKPEGEGLCLVLFSLMLYAMHRLALLARVWCCW
jgi:hypothetical protein